MSQVIQLQYSISVYPGESATDAVDLYGRKVMGSWPLEVKSLSPASVVEAMRDQWASHLLRKNKAGTIEAGEATELNMLKQTRNVIGRLPPKLKVMGSGVLYQVFEPLEGEIVNLIHCIQIKTLP